MLTTNSSQIKKSKPTLVTIPVVRKYVRQNWLQEFKREMAEAHFSLGKVPPSNCQQFIDKGANRKFVYLSNLKP
jgi:hypothetical protein